MIISYAHDETPPAKYSEQLERLAAHRLTPEEIQHGCDYHKGTIREPDPYPHWFMANAIRALLELYEAELRLEYAHDYPKGSRLVLHRTTPSHPDHDAPRLLLDTRRSTKTTHASPSRRTTSASTTTLASHPPTA